MYDPTNTHKPEDAPPRTTAELTADQKRELHFMCVSASEGNMPRPQQILFIATMDPATRRLTAMHVGTATEMDPSLAAEVAQAAAQRMQEIEITQIPDIVEKMQGEAGKHGVVLSMTNCDVRAFVERFNEVLAAQGPHPSVIFLILSGNGFAIRNGRRFFILADGLLDVDAVERALVLTPSPCVRETVLVLDCAAAYTPHLLKATPHDHTLLREMMLTKRFHLTVAKGELDRDDPTVFARHFCDAFHQHRNLADVVQHMRANRVAVTTSEDTRLFGIGRSITTMELVWGEHDATLRAAPAPNASRDDVAAALLLSGGDAHDTVERQHSLSVPACYGEKEKMLMDTIFWRLRKPVEVLTRGPSRGATKGSGSSSSAAELPVPMGVDLDIAQRPVMAEKLFHMTHFRGRDERGEYMQTLCVEPCGTGRNGMVTRSDVERVKTGHGETGLEAYLRSHLLVDGLGPQTSAVPINRGHFYRMHERWGSQVLRAYETADYKPLLRPVPNEAPVCCFGMRAFADYENVRIVVLSTVVRVRNVNGRREVVDMMEMKQQVLPSPL